jgi:hypothetical protein
MVTGDTLQVQHDGIEKQVKLEVDKARRALAPCESD